MECMLACKGFMRTFCRGLTLKSKTEGACAFPGRKGAISATSIYTCLGQKVKGRVGDKAKDKWERSRRHA